MLVGVKMARPPTQLELLVGAGETPDQQFELLRRAGCLTAEALERRTGVIALLVESKVDYWTPRSLALGRGPAPLDSASMARQQVEALAEAGFLTPDAHERFGPMAHADPDDVDEFVKNALAGDPSRPIEPWQAPARPAPDAPQIPCRSCERMIPDYAQFCGWCGKPVR